MTWTYTGKRIMVTGGSGFIGSHLCERLLALGAEVLSVDNYFTGRRRNIAHLKSLFHFGIPEHRALRSYSEADAHSAGQFGDLSIEPRHLFGAARHSRDDQRKAQTLAERFNAQINIFEPGFDQWLMNYLNIFEERGLPAELYVMVCAEIEVTEFAIGDFS